MEPSSAAPFFMLRSLGKHVGHVSLLIPDGHLLSIIRVLQKVIKVANKLIFFNFGRQYYQECIAVSWLYGKIYTRLLKTRHFDLVFAIKASTQIAYVKTTLPIVYFSDATFAGLFDYYPQYKHFFRVSVWEGNIQERRAIHKAALCWFLTKWTLDSAVNQYKADTSKLVCGLTGPNIDEDLLPDVSFLESKPLASPMRLLFIGADWTRKGGSIAYQAMLELNRRGYSAAITICGCDVPPQVGEDSRVTHIRYLDKGEPKQRNLLCDLYKEASWFILPTRAECLGLVFLEAAAFGVPILAPDTGGVKDAVIDGVTGFLMPYSATGADYAERILKCLESNSYKSLSLSARGFYDKRANWDAWALMLKGRLKDAGLPWS